MSKKHLSLRPKELTKLCPNIKKAWFYEENDGLYVGVKVSGEFVSKVNSEYVSLTIPIASIRAYLKRKDK